ncbi:hypothetical protein K505DRAFT_401386, partial [Melanomma pulvis-pyrius CBS 109.77]
SRLSILSILVSWLLSYCVAKVQKVGRVRDSLTCATHLPSTLSFLHVRELWPVSLQRLQRDNACRPAPDRAFS